MSAWSGQVRVDIQPISWNVFRYSQLRRLTGSNLLTFFLTYLLTFFWHIFWYILLTYLLTFFLTYLLTFFLTSFWHIFWYILLTYLLILSDISSDIPFWHAFWHIFWHSFWHIKTKPNIHSFTQIAALQTLIFTSHHAAKVISMTTLCL